MSDLGRLTLQHFRTYGWVRIPAAFSATDAAAMCDVIWAALAGAGIHRDDRSTWTTPRPVHLQHLKADPVFRAVGTARTLQAVDEVLEGQPWRKPPDWGAFFLQFPTGREWNIPSAGWHADGDYTGRLSPPCGVKVHSMLTDVGPRGGGVNILSGSHRLVHRWFSEHPAPAGTRSAQLRKSLERHPYIRDLCSTGKAESRIERFHECAEEMDGIRLQVIENTAAAGDVILMHSLLLHAAAPAAHLGSRPRFLLNQDIIPSLMVSAR